MFCGREAVPAPLVAPVMLLLNDTNNIKQTISTQTISDTNNIRHKQYQTQTISTQTISDMEIMLSTSIYEKNMNKINKSGIHTKQIRLQTYKHLMWIEVINIIFTACHYHVNVD
jgi:hypothetical protein